MNRAHVIIWLGRVLGVGFLLAMLMDLLADGSTSRAIRLAIIGVAALVFWMLCMWQARIALLYEGLPLKRPLPFRWVVCSAFGAMAVFVSWSLVTGVWRGLYHDIISAFVWLVFVEGIIWFAARWVTVDEPHRAGRGETGSAHG